MGADNARILVMDGDRGDGGVGSASWRSLIPTLPGAPRFGVAVQEGGVALGE